MRDAAHYERFAKDPALVPEGIRHRFARIAAGKTASIVPALFALDHLAVHSLSTEAGGEPVYAVANHGRWVAECPDCRGAQLASASDPRFLCCDCGNVANGGRYRPVVWPKGADKIAELLDARPDETLRNWSPPETVADLRAENKALGL